MLGNQVELWETILAAIKLRRGDHPGQHRCSAPPTWPTGCERGGGPARGGRRGRDTDKFAEVPGDYTRIAVGGAGRRAGIEYADAYDAGRTRSPRTGVTRADDPLLLYFTSGTTALPKLVEHTHVSYPIGHLSTMYWIGLRPGDVHLNISSPGWAKHAWSQRVRAVERRGDACFVYNYTRFDAAR